MSNQASKVPSALVVVKGDVWKAFADWAKAEGLLLVDLTSDDHVEIYELRREPR